MPINNNKKAQKTPIFGLGFVAILATVAGPAMAAEVNLYSERQPFLMKPLLQAFTKETGIKVVDLLVQHPLEQCLVLLNKLKILYLLLLQQILNK